MEIWRNLNSVLRPALIRLLKQVCKYFELDLEEKFRVRWPEIKWYFGNLLIWYGWEREGFWDGKITKQSQIRGFQMVDKIAKSRKLEISKIYVIFWGWRWLETAARGAAFGIFAAAEKRDEHNEQCHEEQTAHAGERGERGLKISKIELF